METELEVEASLPGCRVHECFNDFGALFDLVFVGRFLCLHIVKSLRIWTTMHQVR